MSDGNGAVLRSHSSLHAVYIRTLGAFEATKHAARLTWKGAGVGAEKLRNGFAHVIAKRDKLVRRETLIDLTGTHNIVSGIKTMLRNWEMDTAFHLHDRCVMLTRDQSWFTDGDYLEDLLLQALQLETCGDLVGRLAVLDEAELLCGGPFLPEYDSVPEYMIDEQVAFWQLRQKEALQTVAMARLAAEDSRLCASALRAAVQAIRFDAENPSAYQFAAAVARRCGNENRARHYGSLAKYYARLNDE